MGIFSSYDSEVSVNAAALNLQFSSSVPEPTEQVDLWPLVKLLNRFSLRRPTAGRSCCRRLNSCICPAERSRSSEHEPKRQNQHERLTPSTFGGTKTSHEESGAFKLTHDLHLQRNCLHNQPWIWALKSKWTNQSSGDKRSCDLMENSGAAADWTQRFLHRNSKDLFLSSSFRWTLKDFSFLHRLSATFLLCASIVTESSSCSQHRCRSSSNQLASSVHTRDVKAGMTQTCCPLRCTAAKHLEAWLRRNPDHLQVFPSWWESDNKLSHGSSGQQASVRNHLRTQWIYWRLNSWSQSSN